MQFKFFSDLVVRYGLFCLQRQPKQVSMDYPQVATADFW